MDEHPKKTTGLMLRAVIAAAFMWAMGVPFLVLQDRIIANLKKYDEGTAAFEKDRGTVWIMGYSAGLSPGKEKPRVYGDVVVGKTDMFGPVPPKPKSSTARLWVSTSSRPVDPALYGDTLQPDVYASTPTTVSSTWTIKSPSFGNYRPADYSIWSGDMATTHEVLRITAAGEIKVAKGSTPTDAARAFVALLRKDRAEMTFAPVSQNLVVTVTKLFPYDAKMDRRPGGKGFRMCGKADGVDSPVCFDGVFGFLPGSRRCVQWLDHERRWEQIRCPDFESEDQR